MVDVTASDATKPKLRNGAIICLSIWFGIWIVFMLIRFSGFDVRVIPGVGPIMLLLLAAAGILPLAATVLAVVAAIQKPKETLSWIVLGASIAVMIGQAAMFAANKWM